MTGTHVVEECPELNQWRPRRAVWKDSREALGGRAVSKRKKEEEEEGDLLGAFFYRIYEFLFALSNPPLVVHRPHVPERYAIRFVPAAALPAVGSPALSPLSLPAVSLPVLDSFVPAELPARYAINFVPASSVSPVATLPVIPSSSASVSSNAIASSVVPFPFTEVFSVVSSANFIPASAFTSSSCIGTTQ